MRDLKPSEKARLDKHQKEKVRKKHEKMKKAGIHPADTPDQVGRVSKEAIGKLRKILNQDRIIE